VNKTAGDRLRAKAKGENLIITPNHIFYTCFFLIVHV